MDSKQLKSCIYGFLIGPMLIYVSLWCHFRLLQYVDKLLSYISTITQFILHAVCQKESFEISANQNVLTALAAMLNHQSLAKTPKL